MFAAAKAAYDADVAKAATRIDFDRADRIVLRRLRMPAHFNGGALRSMVDVSPAAYLGGMLQAIPAFMDVKDDHGRVVSAGVANHLADVFGADSFADGNGDTRFAAMIASGC